jgi:hypothetical protein
LVNLKFEFGFSYKDAGELAITIVAIEARE